MESSIGYSKRNVCILDGGGRRPLCGSKRYISKVNEAYKKNPSDQLAIYASDDGDEGADCYPATYDSGGSFVDDREKEKFCTERNKGHDICTGKKDIKACTRRLESKSVPKEYVKYDSPSIERMRFNSYEANSYNGIYPETKKQGENNCFPGVNNKNDTCHFWSSNHGTKGRNGGITYHGNGGTFSQKEFSSAIDESSCGQTKYILNNCYSGMFHYSTKKRGDRSTPSKRIKLDKNGKAKVCGVTATQKDEVATGKLEEIDEIELDSPRKRKIKRMAIKANFSELIAKQISKGKTLDEAYAYAYLHNPMPDVPISSSQFFLLDNSKSQEEYATLQCMSKKFLTDNLYSLNLDNLKDSIEEIEYRDQVMADLELQQKRIKEFEKKLCQEVYPDECQNPTEFIQKKYKEAYLNNVKPAYEELTNLREKLKYALEEQELAKKDFKLKDKEIRSEKVQRSIIYGKFRDSKEQLDSLESKKVEIQKDIGS